MKYIIFCLILSLLLYLIFVCHTKTRRNYSIIDRNTSFVLKGIAIFLVILCHIGGKTGATIFTPLGGIGVAIFLFLSGYGVNKSYMHNGLKNFWGKKIKRILIPYALTELVAVFLGIVKYTSINSLMLDFTFINPLHPLGWYMNCLFVNYILFYFSYKFFKKNANKAFILCTILLSILYFVFSKSLYFEQSFSFALGIYLSNIDCSNLINKKNMLYYLLVGITFLTLKQVVIIRTNPYLYGLCDIFIKLPLAISIVIFVNKTLNKLNYEMFYELGKQSYYLYLYHILFQLALIRYIDFGYAFITIYFVILIMFVYILKNSDYFCKLMTKKIKF